MNKTEMLVDRLREIAREYKNAPRTLNQAADMIENQVRNIELLQVALEIERQNHDRLQDWDRGMTEKLASAELQCKQVNEGAAILMKRLSDALEELERVTKERDHALERLEYSNAERDAVTRRMIALEAGK